MEWVPALHSWWSSSLLINSPGAEFRSGPKGADVHLIFRFVRLTIWFWTRPPEHFARLIRRYHSPALGVSARSQMGLGSNPSEHTHQTAL
jgi:hypothetical protein